MSKTKISQTKMIDIKKPIVKSYISNDSSMNKFIETMLPYVKNGKIKIYHLFTVGDISKYRVNWYYDNILPGSPTYVICSKYIQVQQTEKGPVLTDQTI